MGVGIRRRTRSRAEWGARHFDKLLADALPEFDRRNSLHLELAQLAQEAEEVAAAVVLEDGLHFIRARQRIRKALSKAGVAQRIEDAVQRLLGRGQSG